MPASLVQRWQALWEADPDAPPHLEPACFLEITRTLGAEPWLVQLPEGLAVGRLETGPLRRRLGYLPLRTPPLRSLVLAEGGLLGDAPAAALLERVDQMLTGGEIDHAMFYRIPVGSELARTLDGRRSAVRHPPAPHWHLRLGESFHATMAQHSPRHRKRLRWERRRLEDAFDGTLEFRTFEDSAGLDRALGDAARVSCASYHAGVGGLVEDTALWRARLQPAASEGRLRLHLLLGGGQPVAALVGLNARNTLHVLAMAYLLAHARLSPGKHLLLHAIRRACEDGMARVDYGIGDADYKRIYGTGFVEEATVHLFGRTAAARAAMLADRAVLGADRWIRAAAGSRGAALVRNRWRRLLAAGAGRGK